MNLNKFLPEKLNVFILVKETKVGIETYANEKIKDIPKPIKAQIKTFLQEIVKGL